MPVSGSRCFGRENDRPGSRAGACSCISFCRTSLAPTVMAAARRAPCSIWAGVCADSACSRRSLESGLCTCGNDSRDVAAWGRKEAGPRRRRLKNGGRVHVVGRGWERRLSSPAMLFVHVRRTAGEAFRANQSLGGERGISVQSRAYVICLPDRPCPFRGRSTAFRSHHPAFSIARPRRRPPVQVHPRQDVSRVRRVA
ncbi:hypothetical protein OH77DRAFT_688132 [Trametes cingulata]|nr:hypothetical protein OH77DRAFT_688132 [Trametes cingulata]